VQLFPLASFLGITPQKHCNKVLEIYIYCPSQTFFPFDFHALLRFLLKYYYFSDIFSDNLFKIEFSRKNSRLLWWCAPIVLSTWEAEVGRQLEITFQQQ
jgi:hypothetical protein